MRLCFLGTKDMDDPTRRIDPGSDPDTWKLPKWHPDWDGEFEIESLRALAKTITDSPVLSVGFTSFGDGYARLDVFRGKILIGLVYVNRSDDRSLPEFSIYAGAEETELHTTDSESAIAFLERFESPLPDDGDVNES